MSTNRWRPKTNKLPQQEHYANQLVDIQVFASIFQPRQRTKKKKKKNSNSFGAASAHQSELSKGNAMIWTNLPPSQKMFEQSLYDPDNPCSSCVHCLSEVCSVKQEKTNGNCCRKEILFPCFVQNILSQWVEKQGRWLTKYMEVHKHTQKKNKRKKKKQRNTTFNKATTMNNRPLVKLN